MARSYRHIKELEPEIQKMREEGKTKNEIAKCLGLSKKQITNFVTRCNRKKEKEAEGIITKRGRPPKNISITEKDNLASLRYKMTRKDYRIKQLEMEVELLRDFLKETGRK